MAHQTTLSNERIGVGLTSLGGTLTSIVDRTSGVEYLWQADAAYWGGQAPILFPICGSIRGDRATTLGGRELAMPRHGIVRKREWELEGACDDAATYVIRSDEETRAAYPYDFELRSRYRISGPVLEVSYEVTNVGEAELPYFVGGHPGFRCPFAEGDAFEDCYLEFEHEETCTVADPVTETGLIDIDVRHPLMDHARTLDLAHELFHRDAQIMDELRSRTVRLRSRRSAGGVELGFGGFPYLIVWSSANDGPFVALEPWTGLSTCNDEDDVFEHKRNVQVLAPGQTKAYSFTVTLL